MPAPGKTGTEFLAAREFPYVDSIDKDGEINLIEGVTKREARDINSCKGLIIGCDVELGKLETRLIDYLNSHYGEYLKANPEILVDGKIDYEALGNDKTLNQDKKIGRIIVAHGERSDMKKEAGDEMENITKYKTKTSYMPKGEPAPEVPSFVKEGALLSEKRLTELKKAWIFDYETKPEKVQPAETKPEKEFKVTKVPFSR